MLKLCFRKVYSRSGALIGFCTRYHGHQGKCRTIEQHETNSRSDRSQAS